MPAQTAVHLCLDMTVNACSSDISLHTRPGTGEHWLVRLEAEAARAPCAAEDAWHGAELAEEARSHELEREVGALSRELDKVAVAQRTHQRQQAATTWHRHMLVRARFAAACWVHDASPVYLCGRYGVLKVLGAFEACVTCKETGVCSIRE